MARKAVMEGGKREEIISAAFKLFMKNGYEATSVRMILGEVNGEVGMFYHYFKSKNELFEVAIDTFFKNYEKEFSRIASDMNFDQAMQFDALFDHMLSGMINFRKLNRDGTLHWSAALGLRERALISIVPHVKTIIENYMEKGLIKTPDVDLDTIAAFITHGLGGIMMGVCENDLADRKKAAITLAESLLKAEIKKLEEKSI